MKLHSEAERARFRTIRASQMKAQPTPAEAKLRPLLEPLGFRFQVPIELLRHRKGVHDGYVLDFLNEAAKLCVEVDGSAHRNRKGYDRRRDERLQIAGIRTLRFTNTRVLRETNEVMRTIEFWLMAEDSE